MILNPNKTHSHIMNNTTFNGWANYQTWNVSLWIQNDEGLYEMARECRNDGYQYFAEVISECGDKATPDGVSWTDPTLDHDELNEMMSEL